jgi:hypothetical protein
MKYGLLALVILAVLFGAFFLSTKNATQPSPPANEESTAVTVTEKKLVENTTTYSVDVKYPQFGITTIDTHITQIVQDAIAQFKKDTAASPPTGTGATDMKYEFDTTFEQPYIGEDVVSVRLIISTYTGGAHPLSVAEGLNFDRTTGKILTQSDALKMTGLSLQQVAAESLKQMKAKHGSALFVEGLDPTAENYATFVIDEDSVTFIFQLYQVAAYAAGFQEVTFART